MVVQGGKEKKKGTGVASRADPQEGGKNDVVKGGGRGCR